MFKIDTSFITQKMPVPIKFSFDAEGSVKVLGEEIALLEVELISLETEINIFQTQIRSALSTQIQRIKELTNQYKSQKHAKKLKRLEQKKRGKNYKEPVGLKINNASFTTPNFVSADDKLELKRLFKEAIIQIHPDKFVDADEELNQRATDFTAQLNEVYQSGDLEELNRLHEHIISGNAIAYVSDQSKSIKDLSAMLQFLQQKKIKLLQLLEEIKLSGIYELFTSGKDVQIIISELRTAFEERILVMEKRTK